LRIPLIIILVLIPFSIVFSLAGQAGSQGQVISLSTTSAASTLTVGTTTLAALTTSTYGPATGTIPSVYSAYEGPTVCFYVPYPFHVDASAQRIQGTISGSSPFNFYIMSKQQYAYFVIASPPCGSSYQALKLEYAIRSFNLDWVAPQPGDYYILLENTSLYVIAYSIQLSAIQPATALVYTTTTIPQTLTFTLQQEVNTTISTMTSQSVSAAPTESNFTAPLAIALVAALVLVVVFVKRSKLSK